MKKTLLKIVCVMILLVLTYVTVANAVSFTCTMDTQSSVVAEGTEFTVTFSVSNLDVGTNGINSLSGYIKYDKDVFETISDSSIEGLSGWKNLYSSDTGKITLSKTTFVNSDEKVFNVTFKTKTGTSGKEGTISFDQIQASNSETDITTNAVSTTITVGNEATQVANTSSDNTNSITINGLANSSTTNGSGINAISIGTNTSAAGANTNSNSNTNAINSTVNTSKTNTNSNTNSIASFVNTTNTTDESMPYTGVEDGILFVIAAVVIVAILFYIKIERINKEMK